MPTIKMLLSLVLLLAVSQAAEVEMKPPVAPIKPWSGEIHGDRRTDDYHWMLTYPGEKHSPELVSYLEAENAYTEKKTAGLAPLRTQLYQEMISYRTEDRQRPPQRFGAHEYWLENRKGSQYPVVLRRKISAGASDGGQSELLIDTNPRGSDKESYTFAFLSASPDEKYLAFKEDFGGKNAQLGLFDLEKKTFRILRKGDFASVGFAWDTRDPIVYYVTFDSVQRPNRMYAHHLENNRMTLLFEETDPLFEMNSLYNSRDDRFVFLNIRSKSTSETLFLDLQSADRKLRVVSPRASGVVYEVQGHGDDFYILSNRKRSGQSIFKAKVKSPSANHWKLVDQPKGNDQRYCSFLALKKYLVVLIEKGGLAGIEVTDLTSRKKSSLRFDEAYYLLSFDDYDISTSTLINLNSSYDTDEIRFFYQSMKSPSRVYSYSIKTGKKGIIAESKVGGGYRPDDYTVEHFLISARDGVKVPVSLIYKNGVKKDGKAPLFLSAYGAYGFSFPLNYAPGYSLDSMLPLLTRGVIVGIVHARGGGELGLKWYESGRLMKKKNTFFDFIDASETLVNRKYSRSSRMAMRGVSAGGLITGFVANNRPELFHAVLAEVPFVDALNTELDDKIPLTTQEWEEWGNPNQPAAYRYIKSYCPYTNIGKHSYPHMLIRAGLKDTQVMVHEPAKYLAKLRRFKTDSNDLLARFDMKSGHGGSSGQYGELEELAFEFAWLLNKLEVK